MIVIVHVIHVMDLITTNVYHVPTYIYTIIHAILAAHLIYIVFQQLGIVNLLAQLELSQWMVN